VLIGIFLTLRRRHFGGLILGATFSLLPVLHLIGPNFDASLYHERYAMTALALACPWLPSCLQQMSVPPSLHRLLPLAGKLILGAWLILAIVSIRVSVPLWSTQLNLWTWAIQSDPTSTIAKDELISAYMEQGDDASAWKLIDEIVKSHEQCMTCMFNAATLSIKEGNPKRAAFFLQKAKDLPELNIRSNFRTYLTLVAQVEALENHYKQAETVARTAMALDSLDPQPQLVLAIALAMQGQTNEAVRVEDAAIALLTKDKQFKERQKFEALMDYLRAHPFADQTRQDPADTGSQATGNAPQEP
jgi:predicted Zn-dependent protease